MKTKPTGIQCHRPVPRVENGRGWLTIEETAQAAGIQPHSLYWRLRHGWYPSAYHIAGEWRIPVADVQALIPQGPCLGYLVDEGAGENRKTYCAECGGVPTWA